MAIPRVTMPVETARASFFVPDDGTKVEASGVAESGSDTSGCAAADDVLRRDNVGASQMVGVVLRARLRQAAAPAPTPAKKGTSPTVLVVGGPRRGAVVLAWKLMAGRGK